MIYILPEGASSVSLENTQLWDAMDACKYVKTYSYSDYVCCRTIKCHLFLLEACLSVMGSPLRLLLISQVDEHISSSPNPPPWIPTQKPEIHTDQHALVAHIGKHYGTQLHTCTRGMSSGMCGRSMRRNNPFARNRRREKLYHTHTP